MPVNDTSIKLRNGYDGTNELELKPNFPAGPSSCHTTRRVVVIMRERLDDDAEGQKTLGIEVDIDELVNALELIKQSHFEGPEQEPCIGCGRP